MISNEDFWILGTGFTTLILAYVLLKAPDVRVQQARMFTAACGGLSVLFGLAGWLVRQFETNPAALSSTLAAIVPVAIGAAGLAGLWVVRGRLRPRGFQARVTMRPAWTPASEKKYRGYRKVTK